jgi:1-acyl-sn-glycerol-3-phosphate acyltransferase
MGPIEAWRATTQWGPFALRTAMFGTVSCALGPLTRDHRASLWAMREWCRSSASALNIEVMAEGQENVPDGAFVYCSNHQSLTDILCLGAVLPGDFKWAAKQSLWKIPFLGWHLRLAGHVPVERGRGSRIAAAVIERFVDVLRAGKPLLIFPEGTRSEDGVLKGFRNGGFHAAIRAGVPCVPVALEGTSGLLKKHAKAIETDTRTVRVRIGKPIQPLPKGEVREGARVADLRDRTRAAVAEMLLEIGGKVGDDVTPPTSEPPARQGRESSASI